MRYLGLFLFLVLPMTASANRAYMSQFKEMYPDFKGASCKVCHESLPHLNPYGLDFQSHGHDFKAIESLDSDGDTYINSVELTAGTYPGDKNSHP